MALKHLEAGIFRPDHWKYEPDFQDKHQDCPCKLEYHQHVDTSINPGNWIKITKKGGGVYGEDKRTQDWDLT